MNMTRNIILKIGGSTTSLKNNAWGIRETVKELFGKSEDEGSE